MEGKFTDDGFQVKLPTATGADVRDSSLLDGTGFRYVDLPDEVITALSTQFHAVNTCKSCPAFPHCPPGSLIGQLAEEAYSFLPRAGAGSGRIETSRIRTVLADAKTGGTIPERSGKNIVIKTRPKTKPTIAALQQMRTEQLACKSD